MALTPRVVTRLLPGGIRQTTQTRTVNTTLVPWIRSRKVFFKIEGLLPNTKHRPFFDGVDVSVWCREETFQRVAAGELTLDINNPASLTAHPEGTSDLISDSTGTIEGSFFIPNTASLRFRTGAREFKVRDWNATTDESAISKAFASYTAQGTLETQQVDITTIRPIQITPPRFIDPVAQSFRIDKATGAYITSIEVFFKTKSTSVPVRCQIRPMENGLPTNRIVPGAEVMVQASAVNISTSPDVSNSATATKFTFETPVYVEGFREYAIVVLAESIDYEVWTAVTEEFVVGSTTRRITKQPSLGSFFKSQNGSTWTPDQSRDLMFQINRAVFNNGTNGTAYFENVQTQSRLLGDNPLEVLNVQASPSVRVYLPNHGFTTGSKAKFTGLTAVGGITAAQLNAVAGHDVIDAEDFDSFVITVAGATSTSTGFGGGSVGVSEINNQFDIIYPNINQLTHPATTIDWSAKFTTGSSPTQIETDYDKDTTFSSIRPNENNLFDSPRLIASPINESVNVPGAEKSSTWKAVLTSNNNYVAPIVDLSRLSASLIRNRIDNQAAVASTGFNVPADYVAETDATEGSIAAKHIFVPITLETQAIGLKVLFAANRPPNSYIDLYYRVAESGSDGNLNIVDWTLATIDQALPDDDDINVFREYEYTIESATPFTRYQYKIVFRSQSTSNVPRIRDYRSIALAT